MWGGVGGVEGAVTGQVQVEGEVRQGEGGMSTRQGRAGTRYQTLYSGTQRLRQELQAWEVRSLLIVSLSNPS